ncbi:MAG: hypothetical protein RL329_1629 [Bacteroidota bacterium]|jgi:hypothetical protein
MLSKLFLSGLLYLPLTASAQIEKSFHQIIPIEDAYIIQFGFNNYEIATWSGTTVMIQSSIQLDCCDLTMLSHIIQTGRYNLQPDHLTGALDIKVPKRPALKIKGVDCNEVVKIKVFVPDTYSIEKDNQCVLRQSPMTEQK